MVTGTAARQRQTRDDGPSAERKRKLMLLIGIVGLLEVPSSRSNFRHVRCSP